MSGDKEMAKKADELKNVYEEMVDSFELENIPFHYGAWIDVFKKQKKTAPYMALSDEKIAALEKALEDFRAVYAAEKAEAEKMPLSWAEAKRLRDVFDKIFYEREQPPPDSRTEH